MGISTFDEVTRPGDTGFVATKESAMKQFDSASSAIRYGATLRPQALFSYFREGATCAIGAMAEAMGYDPEIDDDVCKAENEFKYLKEQCGGCPECLIYERACLNSVITHLNDDHRWSREQIADWVEQKENELFSYETLVDTSKQQVDVLTHYTLDCSKCHTLSVGDDVYENWKPGQVVGCKKCGEEGLPRTSRMEIGV